MAALIQSNQPSSSMEAEMVDRISDLPIPILHHILSFLPTRDVVRTCVLSKHWCSTCSSFPILEFDIYDVRSYRRGSYNNPIKDEEFLRWVDARVQRLYETNTSIVSLTVAVDLLDPRIFRAIERAMERNVQRTCELEIKRAENWGNWGEEREKKEIEKENSVIMIQHKILQFTGNA